MEKFPRDDIFVFKHTLETINLHKQTYFFALGRVRRCTNQAGGLFVVCWLDRLQLNNWSPVCSRGLNKLVTFLGNKGKQEEKKGEKTTPSSKQLFARKAATKKHQLKQKCCTTWLCREFVCMCWCVTQSVSDVCLGL